MRGRDYARLRVRQSGPIDFTKSHASKTYPATAMADQNNDFVRFLSKASIARHDIPYMAAAMM